MAIITKVLSTSPLVDSATGFTATNDVLNITLDQTNGGANAGSLVTAAGGAGNDEIRFTQSTVGPLTGSTDTLVLGAGVTGFEFVTLTTTTTGATLPGPVAGTADLNIDASAVQNGLTITGNTGDNLIIGTEFNDTINGGGSTGGDSAVTASGFDDIQAGGGNDNILISGSAYHDAGSTFDGGTGVDTVQFGSAASTAATPTDILTLDDGTGVNAIDINIEKVKLLGAANYQVDAQNYGQNGLMITGNAGANTIQGTAKADIIEGGAGADNLQGGLGEDVFVINNAADYVAGDVIDGAGAGSGGDFQNWDAILFASTTAGATLTLNANVSNVEEVAIGQLKSALTSGSDETVFANADFDSIGGPGTTTGTTALNIDASAWDESANLASRGLVDGIWSGLFLTGNDGNNIITGTTGDDVIGGGAGNDIIIIKNSADHDTAETIGGGAGSDEIRFTSATAGDTLVLSPFVDVETVKISTAAGLTTGTVALNLDASAVSAPDQMAANQPLNLIGNDGDNVIAGSLLMANNIVGGAGSDILTGGDFNDTLTGGAGADVLMGGDGDDTYVVAAVADITGDVIDDASGTDTLSFRGAGTITLSNNLTGIERVDLGAAAIVNGVNAAAVVNGLEIVGNAGANAITGTAFADTITGGAGADALVGNDGDDVFIVNNAADFVATDSVNGGTGRDAIVFAAATGTLTLNAKVTQVEDVFINTLVNGLPDSNTNNNAGVDASTVTTALNIFGNLGNNTIKGGLGADVIIGGGGNDTMDGKAGSDTYVINAADDYNLGDLIADTGVSGTDTLLFAGDGGPDTLVLKANTTGIESVVLGDINDAGSMSALLDVDATLLNNAITITGNDAENTITGTRFADTILAGDGNDTVLVARGFHHSLGEKIDGGDGVDEVIFTSTVRGDTLMINAKDTGIETVTLGAADGDISGTTALRVNASMYKSDLTIVGNDGNNTLTGGYGDDTISGNGGNDTLNGGAGDDTLDGGAGLDFLVGGGGDDSLDGGVGPDVLVGGLGADEMLGGDNSDIFIIYNGAEHGALEAIDGGANDTFDPSTGWTGLGDTIYFASKTSGDTLTLSADVSNVETVMIATPSPLGPVQQGTSTAALNVDAHNVSTAMLIVGNGGANTITGTDYNLQDGPPLGPQGAQIDDYLSGLGGNDTLIGGAGNDVLNGGAGNDTLTGGLGNDTFFFGGIGDGVATVAGLGVDTLADFDFATDTIGLELALFNGGLTGASGDLLDAGDFISGAGVTGGAFISLNTTTGSLYYDADAGGAGAGVQIAHLDPTESLNVTSSNFWVA